MPEERVTVESYPGGSIAASFDCAWVYDRQHEIRSSAQRVFLGPTAVRSAVADPLFPSSHDEPVSDSHIMAYSLANNYGAGPDGRHLQATAQLLPFGE